MLTEVWPFGFLKRFIRVIQKRRFAAYSTIFCLIFQGTDFEFLLSTSPYPSQGEEKHKFLLV